MLTRLLLSIGLAIALLLFTLYPLPFTLYPAPASAANSPDRLTLTLDLLQERLKAPIPSEGTRIIDLRRMTIDLRPENAAFRDQFYSLLQAQLQRPGMPLGLDLSYALIEGDFSISKLGLRAPLYGQSLSPLFTDAEKAQLQRDRRRLSRLSTLSQSLLITPKENLQGTLQITVFRGPLKLTQARVNGFGDFTNTFFLNRVDASGVQFPNGTDWTQARFSLPTSFASANFGREAQFRNTIFFAKADFNQVQFRGEVNFQGSEFQATANFDQSVFYQLANLTRVQWLGTADFAQTRWRDQALFTKDKFSEALFLTDASFEKVALFRESQFNRPVNLRGATILDRVDFSYSGFAKAAYLNVPGLRFDSDRAKFFGDPGRIGRVISVPTLQGNENLLRELVRNFRRLEQIADANQIDYTTQRLRAQELRQRLLGVNVNTATIPTLLNLGLRSPQAAAIVAQRTKQPFRNFTELLSLPEIDLATYISVRDRMIAVEPLPPALETLNRLATGFNWLSLSVILLLSRDGTSFWLIFGVGLVTVAYFSVLFWVIDRWRRRYPQPILPTWPEFLGVLALATLLGLAGLTAIFRMGDRPWMTLACLAIVAVPIPLVLLLLIYYQGRYHPLLDSSYFLEEGTLRQMRIAIGRLPNVPRFPLFRERYLPILWERRWGWLNYFDFSLNNFLRFGFNDIRLRDEHVPSLFTALVWYQWSLGMLYLALILWTLSRTIPGLNLLIYFK
jgi:Helix-hairpin-helix motif